MAGAMVSTRSPPLQALLGGLAWAAFAGSAYAHEHHEDNIAEGEYVSPDPIDTILWLHIMIQIFAWGVIFPTGMVLGMVRSRWHVPLQVVGVALAIVGYFLGHAHGGRQFSENIHAAFASSLGLMLAAQVILGIYLKLHLEKGINGRIRGYVVPTHGVLGKALPVVSWVQMLFGGITAMGYCREDHLGQCLAHFIMGSAFIAYGIILMILLLVGQAWLRRTSRSQEFFDSLIIALWGCVNTFTEHRWGQDWRANDLQHTSMGIVWWCAGLLGMWLSRKRNGQAKRNIIPGMVIILTGWAMSAHPQSLELSTHVHTVFGYTLMAAGAVRIVEISFVLRDRPSVSARNSEENSSFQYLTPYLLCASGFLFMGATEEQMALLSGLHVTHVSYILLLFSIAFLLFLFVNVLLHIYAAYTWPVEKAVALPKKAGPNGSVPNGRLPNGSAALSRTERQRVQDAAEFELEALMSDDETGGEPGRRKEEA